MGNTMQDHLIGNPALNARLMSKSKENKNHCCATVVSMTQVVVVASVKNNLKHEAV